MVDVLAEVAEPPNIVQKACAPKTKRAETIDGNGLFPSALSKIALKQSAAANSGTIRPIRMLITKLVTPVVILPPTVPNSPDDDVDSVAAGTPEKRAGIVVENKISI